MDLPIHPKYAKFDGQLAKRIYSVAVPGCLMMALPSVLTGILNGILVKIAPVYVEIVSLKRILLKRIPLRRLFLFTTVFFVPMATAGKLFMMC